MFLQEASHTRPFGGLGLIQGKSGSGKGGAIALQRVALGGRATAIKNNWLKNKDLLDALVTMAIEQIRRVGFFHPGAAGYVPPGGAEDLATARGLDGMDPLPGWLERLGDEWDERSTDDARLAFMESPGTQGREVSMRVFGDRVNESKRWTKRRAEVDGVQATRLFLAKPLH